MQKTLERQIPAAGLEHGAPLVVAVSGGADSVVLLHLLHELADRYGLRLHVAHLNHQVRPEGSNDADFVRHLCAKLKLPCVVESVDVPVLAAEMGVSLEMAGREARRKFLLRHADRVGARLIAVAHHRDDQVETFFLRLLRGSGVAGLSAMQFRQDRWWRPLLECSREQILAYARRHKLGWVEDQSNSDPAFLRNRMRHQLLPQLREINLQFDERVSELCRQLRADELYWQQQVKVQLPALIVSTHDGLRLDRQKLLALPEALRIRVLREALRQVRGDLQRLEAVHLRAVSELLTGERSQAQLDLPGCWVARRYETLWLREQAPVKLKPYELSLPVPGELLLPCGRTLRAQLQAEPSGESATVAEFAWAGVAAPLEVRNWRPGDCFTPQGIDGHKKIKRLFGDLKVESEERSRVPLLLSAGEILWVAGLRRSSHASVAASSGEILRLELF